MYGRKLEEFLFYRDARVVTFADDSYVIIEADDREELKRNAEECLKDHDAFLKMIGMCTNTAKTEAVIFGKSYEAGSLMAGDQSIQIAKTIKVLGITFSYNLSWLPHIKKAVKKAASICNRIKFIRQSLSTDQTLKVLTSYYYSSMYYGSAVWLGSMTTSNEW
jgi:hypothetical protein